MFLQRSEAAAAFHLVRESTRNNVSTVYWATGTLDGKTKSIEIPVDSATQRITFAFSADVKGTALKVTQPSGGAITQGSASMEITDLNCGRILTISSPEAGKWRAEIAGTGRYWIQAMAQSDIYFIRAEFVKVGGRPGHQGMFRIQGQPLAGAPATMQASLSAKDTITHEFYLVNEQGETIQKLQMHAENADREFLEFSGSVELPAAPFRVAVSGRDDHGKEYQRFFSSLFHAETVEVTPNFDFDELRPGNARQAVFRVRNTGSGRTFRITVTDAHQFVTKVEPKELPLGAGETGTVLVDLTVPAETAAGIGDDIVIVAESTSSPPTSNSSVAHVSVAASR